MMKNTKIRDWRSAIPLVQTVYSLGSAGHCCHIVIDDLNIKNADLDWGMNYAQKRNCGPCQQLLSAMRFMSKTQRYKLASQWRRYEVTDE